MWLTQTYHTSVTRMGTTKVDCEEGPFRCTLKKISFNARTLKSSKEHWIHSGPKYHSLSSNCIFYILQGKMNDTESHWKVTSVRSSNHAGSPVALYPSCPQTTWASSVPQLKSLHTVPNVLFRHTSTRPSCMVLPDTKRTFPSPHEKPSSVQYNEA